MGLISEFRGPYHFLSNFYPSPIMVDGMRYPTVEHAFQAAKTRDKIWREKIRTAETPSRAKLLGRRCPMRDDWEQKKLEVMEYLLTIKFKSPALQRRLMETGNEILIEGNTWGDTYWGAVRSRHNENYWEGENQLGQLLMKLRKEMYARH